MQARHGLAERLVGLQHVALRPGGHRQEPGRPAAGEVVVGAGEVEGPPGLPRGALDVAARLRHGGPVHRDGRRQGAQLVGGGPLALAGAGGVAERALGVVEPGEGGVEVAAPSGAGPPRTR